MNSAAIKAKGRKAKNDVIAVLKPHFPEAERRRQMGFHDRGDIAGVPFTVLQVKDWARMSLSGWLKDLKNRLPTTTLSLALSSTRSEARPTPGSGTPRAGLAPR